MDDFAGCHEWGMIGHLHLQPWELEEAKTGGDFELDMRELCGAHLVCLVCERPYSEQEDALLCDGPPQAYTRSGYPIHSRDN